MPPIRNVNILTFEEACAFLKFKPSKLYSLTSSKQIPHKKCRGLLRFFEHELIAWLDENHEGPKAA